MGSTANILLCRLCQCEGLVENFEELFIIVDDGRVQAHPVSQKIERYLELEVKLDDSLPKRICKSCEIRIEQWSQYFEACHILHDELQARVAHTQRLDSEILVDREQHWSSERPKMESWNDTTQGDHWDSVMNELSGRKESYDVPRDHLDHSSSPGSDCYTGINGLLKAAEVTGLEEARLEKGAEFRLENKIMQGQSHEGDYAEFYPYNPGNEDDLMGESLKEQYSPSGPINLTGNNNSYSPQRDNHVEWRQGVPNTQHDSSPLNDTLLPPASQDEVLVLDDKSNLTADQLVQLLGSKHPALKGQLAQALIGQHLSLAAGPSSLTDIDQDSVAPLDPPALVRHSLARGMGAASERGGSLSHSEEGSVDDWGSSGHSGGYSEVDVRHVPVLTSTGKPPEVQTAETPSRHKIPLTVEQIRTPRTLSQKDLNELSSLFERDDKQGIMAFINRATRQTVRMWRCTRCSATIEGLMRHLEDHYTMGHSVEPEYECDLCEEVLHSSHTYVRHWASHIPIKRCDICNKAGGNFYQIAGNEDTPRRVVCEVCSRRYMVGSGSTYNSGASGVVSRAKRLPSGPGDDGKYPCDICGKRLKSKQTLSTHMTLHKDDKSIPCPECAMSFNTKADLRAHRATAHENDKRFVCPVSECQKRFKTRVALKGHETLHTGEKPYKCPICPKEIRAQSNFYTHLKVHRKRGEDIPPLIPPSGAKRPANNNNNNPNVLVSINDLLLPTKEESNTDMIGNQNGDHCTESSSSDFQESPMASDLSLRSQGHMDTESHWGYDIDQ